MGFVQEYELDDIHNEVKAITFSLLEEQLGALQESDVCLCKDCVQDMACYALNRVSPRYSLSLLGTLYTHAELDKMKDQIRKIVDEAIQRISIDPHHS